MDLIAIIGIIYFVGLPIMPILIRVIPGLNDYLHENVNVANPAVFVTITWPVSIVFLILYQVCRLVIATINWISGNGFITKSNKHHSNLWED